MKILPVLSVFFHIMLLSVLLLVPISVKGSEGDVGMIAMGQSPYGFENDEGQITGVLYDVLKQIRTTSGIGSAVEIQPAKRMLATLLKGKRSCTIVVDSPEIVESLDIIEPVGYKLTAGILPVAGVKLKDYSSLTGKIIAVPLGILFDEKFHNDKSLNKLSTPQYINAIKMMKAGRVDAIAGAISALKYIAGKEGLNAQFFGQPLIFVEAEFYLVCSFKLSEIERTKLQQAVVELRSSGATQEIFDSYFSLPEQ
ncbi:MAG: hypothetical protein OFPI_01680 [Osedax symbiont Rs2]|nr:MAG: hypothetical protein OFPI_01680 [Osedax symbiont Rs2]